MLYSVSGGSKASSFNFLKKKGGLRLPKIFGKGPVWKKLAKLGLVVAIAMTLFGLSAIAFYSKDLPDPNKINSRIVVESTQILDRNGKVLYDIFGEEKRRLVSWDEIPQNVKNATVAIEDKDFYKHSGIDITRTIYSILYDIVTLSRGQGGSTITQQFIRNALLTRQKLVSRKIKEIALSIQIERKFSKDEILRFYLNEVPYGSNAYGVEAAAQTYFSKPVSQVTLAEAAYLAALPQGPTLLSPYGPNKERLDSRKNTVLQLMYEQGYITEEERDLAQNEEVEFSPVKNSIEAPHFTLYIQDLLVQKYGEKTLRESGLKVTTSLDLDLQKKAEEAVAEHAEKNATQYNASNASLVAIDPRTGEVLAMVGSKDYFNEEIDGQVNVALRPRQPGSSFKPYIYATAFKEGYAPASMLMDVVTNFGEFGGESYVPLNYNNQVRGPVSIREALASSLNIPAVKMILLVGLNDSIKTARDMGITTLDDPTRYGPSLVLGGGEVKLIDHVSAYGVFATGGTRHDPVTILKIEDTKGEVLEEHKESEGQRVLDEEVAFLMNSVLSDNNARATTFGNQNYLTLSGRPVAAKTGTTQEYRDAWTVGYTPQLAAGVWAGNSDNTKMKAGAGGSAVAAPIWNSFMRKALEGVPAENFARPDGIRDIAVDKVSGKLPTGYTPETKPEVFASFAIPEEFDDVHIPIQTDRRTGQPATKDTPKDEITTQVYTVFHSEKPSDPAWEDPVIQWAKDHGYSYPGIGSGTVIQSDKINLTSPDDEATITSFPIKISAEAQNGKIKKLTLFFDNKEIFSSSEKKISYFYSGSEPDGPHTITALVEDESGASYESSRKITLNTGMNVALTSPAGGEVIFFPYQLTALGNSQASGVEFYYQKDNEAPIKISGAAVTVPQSNGSYTEYRLTWQGGSVPSGTYKLFAQSSSGQRSQNIDIIVP